MPRPGQVLGLVGTNGIGKSTALKVLAGKLKPNLGRFDVSATRSTRGHGAEDRACATPASTCPARCSTCYLRAGLPLPSSPACLHSKLTHIQQLLHKSASCADTHTHMRRTHQTGKRSLPTSVALSCKTTSRACWKTI